VARVLIVGCGCRGRALAAALQEDGHEVRGTSRSARGCAAIEREGIEAAQADPDRLGTLLAHLADVSVVCWLMGSAEGDGVEAVHGPRWRSMVQKLVDTPVRGAVYEGAGSVAAPLLEAGAVAARKAAHTFRMPVEVIAVDPADHPAWLASSRAAVEAVLSP
jgi:GDP-D-mannose dehydratase